MCLAKRLGTENVSGKGASQAVALLAAREAAPDQALEYLERAYRRQATCDLEADLGGERNRDRLANSRRRTLRQTRAG
jgi:hypothetical protein